MAGEEVVLSNKFPEIMEAIRVARKQLLRKAAFDVQALAQSNAPVATGFLKSSIYVRTAEESTYGQGVVAGKPDSYLLPEVDKPDDSSVYIAVGANYAIYVEYGTSKMAAQPFLTPAYDLVRPMFIAAWGRLEDYLRAAAAL